MTGKSILRLSPIVAAALAAVSVIGWGEKSSAEVATFVNEVQSVSSSFDPDLVGYWIPFEDEIPFDEETVLESLANKLLIRIDSNGEIFENTRNGDWVHFGVVQDLVLTKRSPNEFVPQIGPGPTIVLKRIATDKIDDAIAKMRNRTK